MKVWNWFRQIVKKWLSMLLLPNTLRMARFYMLVMIFRQEEIDFVFTSEHVQHWLVLKWSPESSFNEEKFFDQQTILQPWWLSEFKAL